jgi:cyclopropane-fatty-acyl-phospholipid synthase
MSSPLDFRATRRLENFKRLLAHLREQLGLDIGFVLWEGSTVPTGLAPDAFAIKFADEGTVAALLRRPKLETLAHLWVARRVEQINGTLIDLAHIHKTRRTREFRRTLNKFLVLRALSTFLLVPRGGPWPLDRLPIDQRNTGDPAENLRNIAYHYDVSNRFYELWLDKEMVYSCGYCTDWNNNIDRMQHDKMEMICRKLRLKGGERLLDLGCGWGALSIYAATHYGVTCHAITLSKRQVAYAQEKVNHFGLADRVKVALKDYSLLDGEAVYDKIASIGVQEHIGLDNYPKYYATMKRLLKPEGLILQQAITWPGKRRHRGFRFRREEGTLFNRYIFPGGDLDHIGNIVSMLERHGFEVQDVENWREHYQRTCKHWHDRLLKNYDAAVAEVGETQDSAVARLSRHQLDHVRAEHLQPASDAGLATSPRTVRTTSDTRRSLSLIPSERTCLGEACKAIATGAATRAIAPGAP